MASNIARALRLHLACLLLLLLAACASGGGQRVANTSAEPLPPPDTTTASGAYSGASDYRIGAHDLLGISVFGVEELNKDVRVNSNGQVSLPLIGTVLAGGKTIAELEAELARKYADGFLQNPQVTVFVKEYTSQRITLEGAFNKPGIYPITGRTTLLQGIAIGGGLNDQLADPGAIVVMRNVGGRRMAAVYDLRQVRRGTVENPELYGDDIIVVEQSGSKTAFRRLIESIPVLGVFSFL
jgi:polysaccharide export outer membrane protein